MTVEKLIQLQEGTIISKILILRNKKVMMDFDLAGLYNVTTGNLNKAVKRNLKRFPDDFMFQLTIEEFDNLIFQIGISKWGGTRRPPYAFTEQGVAMLSSILHSDRAIMVNIQIIRVFSKLRELFEMNSTILRKLEEIKRKDIEQDQQILLIFEYLKQLEQEKHQEIEIKERCKIGFKRQAEND
jgi:hypothetical protein